MLADDGLATGATMRAAIVVLCQPRPARLVVAVLRCPPMTIASLSRDVYEIVCPATPEPFFGIVPWYEDLAQIIDQEVRLLLERAWQDRPGYSDGSVSLA